MVCIVKKRSFINQEPIIESTVNHLTLYVNGINNILTLNEIGVRKRICEFVIVLVCQEKRAARRDVVPVFCSPFINFQSRIISHAIVNPTTHSSSGWEELLPKISGPHCIKYLWTIQTWGLGMLKVSLRLPRMTSTELHVPCLLFSYV